jgi:NAD(P)-dependent dehydrogenase (short-subunit alcohol dehydrogenase family)
MAKTGVTVNAICPGYVDTELVGRNATRIAARTGRAPAEIVGEFVKGNPQGRLVSVAEVADAVLWLSGDLASAVNGEAIVIAGGER